MTPTVTLSNGVEMPRIGLGVFRLPPGPETRRAVATALQAGYRHIDTAKVYGNEADVGAAIRESGLARQEVFITTKLWNDDQGYDAALRGFDASLERLGLETIDLYLVHWPLARLRLESWRALERLYAEKRCRAIGVSNFLEPHLTELLKVAKQVPMVNQIELSPFLYPRPLVALCGARNIHVTAYSPLTKGRRLGDSTLLEVARRCERSPAQVLLRWALQHGFSVIPKSAQELHIRQNLALFDFEIPPAEMARLDALHEGFHTAWNPQREA